ncbi:MAG TPA: cytochrome P450 [Humisphaera sp.]
MNDAPTHSTTPPPRHPSPLPGPRSYFPGQIGWAVRRDPLNFFVSVNRRYGNAAEFRVGKGRLFLFNEPEVTRDILVTQADKFTKSPALGQAKVMLGEGLLTSEGDFHKRQRKLSQPAFHPGRVARYAEAISRQARRTGDAWQDGGVVDLHAEMMRVTLRVVTETLFSSSVDAEVDAIGESMDVLIRMFRRSRNPLAPILNKLPLPSNYRFLRAREHVRRTVDRFVAENRAAGTDRGDLLSTLIRARDAGGDDAVVGTDANAAGGMTDEQLRDEVVTLFAAGHETTANALTFTWWLLARHPQVADRLYAEVDAVLEGRDPTAEDQDRLPFCRAVVAESMRLYPPAWTVMRSAKVDVEVGPQRYLIPARGIPVMCQWISHHDPRWWPNPDRFDPDRWLDRAQVEARPRWAYFPFGGGPRNCIGEAFAWTEAVLILATLAQGWRMTDLTRGPLHLIPTITLRPRDPVMVRLAKR